MTYIFFAWVASFSSALTIIISKLTSKHAIANPWLFNFLWSLIVVLFIIPLAIMNHATIPHYWVPIVLASITGALFYIFYILAIYRLDVSTISPLFNFRTVFAVFLGVLFLQEKFTTHQVVLSAIIIVAGIFATVDEKFHIHSFFNPSVGIGLTAMAFLSLNNASIKWAFTFNDVWTVNLWIGIISFIVVLPTLPLFYKDLLKIKTNQLWPVGLMGLFQTLTNFALTSALAVNVGITSIIMSIPFSMILAVLFSIFAPKLLEKHTIKIYIIRFTAAIIMIYGALQLSR